MEFVSTVAGDGKIRELTMIHLDKLPMWLATIEESRVAAHVKPKLVEYQNECARVLRDHFFPDTSGKDPIVAVLESALETRHAQLRLEARQQELELAHSDLAQKQAETNKLAHAAMDTAQGNFGYFAVLGYLKRIGHETTPGVAARHGRNLTSLCRQQGIEIHEMSHPLYGKVNLYPESLLRKYFENLNN